MAVGTTVSTTARDRAMSTIFTRTLEDHKGLLLKRRRGSV